jgi:type IV secretion system protein VirB8
MSAAADTLAHATSETDLYEQAVDWEIDRDLMRDKSERRAWAVAKGACALAALLAGGIVTMAALREVVFIPIIVDRITGATYYGQRLDDNTVPAIDALDKGNAERFVRAREGYVYRMLQNDMDAVARMSTPEVFAPYFKPFDTNETRRPRDEDWKGNVEQRVEIIGTRLTGAARDGSKGREAIVTYDLVSTYFDGARPNTRQRYVATVRFEYRPNMKMKPQDRNENPFGFVVTSYRADVMATGVTQ